MQFPNLKFSQIAGGLFGALVGDACGVPYEFKSARELPPYEQIEMTPPPNFERTYGVPVGTWSDDGALSLCLLESLVECDTWNAHDFGQHLVAWYDEGVWAVGSEVFDVGVTTAAAIRRIRQGANAETAGDADHSSNGNGSLMRALPVALWALQHDLDDGRNHSHRARSIVRDTRAFALAVVLRAVLFVGCKYLQHAKSRNWLETSRTNAAHAFE